MFAQNAQPKEAPEKNVLAPVWHTAALVGLILAVAALGTLLGGEIAVTTPNIATGSRITTLYFPLLLVQWGLIFYVVRVRRPARTLRRLLGKRWENWRGAITDVALAICTFALIQGFTIMTARLFDHVRAASVIAFVPDSTSERLVWTFVAVNVGFCEEVVYRGYLQTQLAAFTRSATLGIALQAVLFGIAHGEQGALAMMQIAVDGLFLGVLAQRSGSLLPCIICHVGVDIAGGLLGR